MILFTEGQEPSKEELFEAAAIAAWHSKGSSSENVPVDYTRVKYVKKPAGSKPGMVIFTHNKTLYVDPALPGPQRNNFLPAFHLVCPAQIRFFLPILQL